MFERKCVIALTDHQRRVLVRGLADVRNGAIREGRPTEDVDDLILKVIDAPTIKGPPQNRRFRGERSRSGVIELSPKAEAKDTELVATKWRADREAR